MNRLDDPFRVGYLRQMDAQLALFCHHLAFGNHHFSMEVGQAVHQQDVSPAAGGDHAQVAAEAKMLGGVDGCHLERRHRRQALRNGVTQNAIHVAVLRQCRGVGIVGA